jgi:Domain of unknown function (DUF4150)
VAVTIHVNGLTNSLVHKGSMGIAKCTVPDVCKTPSPGGPVPVPYPVIVSFSSDLAKGTKTVKVDGGNMAAIKGSEFSRCVGDEPGTAGGVKSSTNMKEATWILYSFDVKLEGRNACRLSDKMLMNHGNTVCLGGEGQEPVKREDINVVERCLNCGKPLNDPSHQPLKTNDRTLVRDANDPRKNKDRSGKTVGAMSVGGGEPSFATSGGGGGKLYNLKTKREIPLTTEQKTDLEGLGNALGNCAEQKLLNREFIDKGAPFPPPGGIRMGIAEKIKGTPSAKELRGSTYKKPCGTCEPAMVAMLCTNEPLEE